jgi:hypothetical protein
MFADDAEIDLRRLELPDMETLRGTADRRAWISSLFEYFPDFEFRVEEVIPKWEWVLVSGSMYGRAQLSGVEIWGSCGRRCVRWASSSSPSGWNSPRNYITLRNIISRRQTAASCRRESGALPLHQHGKRAWVA